MPVATPPAAQPVIGTISAARFQTYLNAEAGDATRALELYAWNARISSALMLPAHFAEVAARNVVADALSAAYGPNWPWDPTFEQSLPNPHHNTYKPRRDLASARQRYSTTGKVIAELKFVFWQKMFTQRHDVRLWGPHIVSLFPHAPAAITPAQLRGRVYNDLESIRLVRNRMAHHEPIFTRPLADDLSKMLDLVDIRSAATGTWVRALEDVTTVLTQRP
ncbi:hypothetical protein [Nocardioides lijunqiniae]|uniref:hypothetical protein n=1 Tax=Nocardioides lijunqiniae TaxID=2760832 RepID=UPI001D0C9FAE|nr:hypothetical protein [Nocardioides lijunqiniae]